MSTVLFAVFAISNFSPLNNKVVQAATSSTVNFQARILKNTGSVVADGDYNVEFKIYNVSGGGAALWTETYTNANKIRTVNGYVSTSLGSVNPFPANLNWDQDLWITINIGGTGAPSWDGEMNPRMKLTAVPHAMSASKLQVDNGTFNSSLSFTNPTVGNQSFVLPDLAVDNTASPATIITTGNLSSITGVGTLTSGTWNASVIDLEHGGTGANLTASNGGIVWTNGTAMQVLSGTATAGQCLLSGSNDEPSWGTCYNAASVILNQNSSQQTANYWISGTGQADTSFVAPLFDTPTNVALNIGTTNATQINLNKNTIVTTGNTIAIADLSEGSVLFSGEDGVISQDNDYYFYDSTNHSLAVGTKNPGTTKLLIKGSTSDSTAAGLSVTDSSDASILYVRNDGNVGIGTSAPTSALHVVGTNSLATVGASSLTATGDFSDNTGWTEGGGWSIGGGVATHSTGNTASLTGTSTGTTTWAVYQINFTTTVTTAGDGFTVSLGGSDSGKVINSAGAQTVYIKPGAGTGTLSFTPGPAGTFVGSIDDVTIYALNVSTPDIAVTSSNGASTPLEVRAGGSNLANTFIGSNAGLFNLTGTNNSAVGVSSLSHNTTGYSNAALGTGSLSSNTTGYLNSAIGHNALQSNTTGFSNTAVGAYSLQSNTTGSDNNAFGYQALRANTSGTENNAYGNYSLSSNTTGSWNNAYGYYALKENLTGYNNSTFGTASLQNNTTGYSNSAFGNYALMSNTQGRNNTAIGNSTINFNQTGEGNTAVGYGAGYGVNGNSYSYNSIFGFLAGSGLTTGSNNLLLGYQVGDNITSGGTNILIGNDIEAQNATGNNQLSIGNVLFGSGGFGTGTTVGVGSIGIGSSSPTTARLVVKGTTTDNTAAALNVTDSADASLLYVRNDGSVGIGTSSPKSNLHVLAGGVTSGLGAGPLNRGMTISGNIGDNRLYFESVNSASGRRVLMLDNSGGILSFNSLNDDASAFINQNILNIRYDGNVGVGASTPQTRLHVEQTAASSTAEEIARFTISDDANSYLKVQNAVTNDNNFSAKLHGFYNGSGLAGITIQGDAQSDTGNVPISIYQSTIAGGSASVTRPTFSWRNLNTTQMQMSAGGILDVTTGITTPQLDTASAVALNIGAATPTTTQINLNQNTVVAVGKTISLSNDAAAGIVTNIQVTGDTNPRLTIGADGNLSWGPGNVATDTTLYREASGTLRTGGNLWVNWALSAGTGSFANTKLSVDTNAATNIGAIIRGVNGQTADLIQLRDNNNNVLTSFGASGNLILPAASTTNASLRITGGTNTPSSLNGGEMWYDTQTGGHLYFRNGGSTVDLLVGAASGWSDTGTVVVLQTLTDNVSIGTASDIAKLGIVGDTDEVQLRIRANAAQTNNIFEIQDSAGTTNYLTMSTTAMTLNGNFTFASGANRTLSVASNAAGAGYNLSVLAGNAGSGNTNGGDLTLSAGARAGSGVSGRVIIKPQAGNDSTTAFQVQNAAGTGYVLNVDTTNNRVGINTNAPSADLTFGAGANRTINVLAQPTGFTAGNNLTVQAGTGNQAVGGTLNLYGGTAGSSSNGGQVSIKGGDSVSASYYGGSVTVAGGSASGVSGGGGNVTIQGGVAAAASGSNGGAVTVTGANGSITGTGGIGGNLTLSAGTSGGNRTGGTTSISSGGGGTNMGAGGNLNINAGAGGYYSVTDFDGYGNGGNINMGAGAGSTGGNVTISAGTGMVGYDDASGNIPAIGGSINLVAGSTNGAGDGSGGSITLTAGSGLNSNGSVVVKNAANSTTAFQVQNAAGTTVVLNADTTNSRIGIGPNVTAPTAFLQVAASSATTASLRLTGGTNTPSTLNGGELWYDTSTTGHLYFRNGGSTVDLLSNATGSFIQNQNTSAQSSSNFWISGTGTADTSFVAPLYLGSTTADETITIQGNSAAAGNTATNANIQFKVGNSGTTTAVTILNNGNVGIGQNDPDSKLTVQDIDGVDSNKYLAQFIGGDAGNLMLQLEAKDWSYAGITYTDGNVGFGNYWQTVYNRDNSAFEFRTPNAWSAFSLQDNTGNIGISTAPTTTRLTVKASTSDNTASALNVTDSNDATLFSVRNDGLATFGGSVAINGLTQGSVLFAGANNNISQDNDYYFYDSTNHSLAIGTNTPGTTKLLIKGSTSDNTASALNVIDSSDVSLFSVRNDGHVGIGDAPRDLNTLTVVETFDTPNYSQSGITSEISWNPSSSSPHIVQAINGTGAKIGDQDMQQITGVAGYALLSGTGTLTNAFAQSGSVRLIGPTNSGTITYASAFEARVPVREAGNTGTIVNNRGIHINNMGAAYVTNAYGLYIEDQTGAATLNYSIYSAGGLNYLAGNLSVGTTISTEALNLNGNIMFASDTDRSIYVQAQDTAATQGSNLTVSAATGNTSGAGGNLILQGGTGGTTGVGGNVNIYGGAAGGGDTNGGNINLFGGAPTGLGAKGLIVMDTPTYTTTSNADCAINCTITQSLVDGNAAIIVKATNPGLTVTMPDPSQSTAGRVIYITGANGSNDFSLAINAGGTLINIAMRQNSTATLIWNGADWTAAGASSSTTLQAAYDNTLISAGGAEIVLNNSVSSDGLTVRNNASNPIIGSAIFEAQTSIGSNLFSVNNNAVEYASNGGAETAGGSSSTFPANTWDAAPGGGTVSRYTTTGNYIPTGQASVSIVTSGAGHGAANRLSTTLTPNLKYTVSYTVRGTTSFSTLNTIYSRDGTDTSTTTCKTGSTVTTGIWTRVTCSFTVPSSGVTSSNAIFIRQSDSTARTFYIDNLSVTVSADVNHATDGSVDDAANFTTNWTAYGAGTAAARETSTIYDTSGSARADVPANTFRGIRNKLSIAPQPSTQYLVTLYARASVAMTDFSISYTRDAGTNVVFCSDYNTRSVTTDGWTKITCLFTTDETAPTNPYLTIYQDTTATARSIYIDALEVTLNSNTSSNVQIGGGSEGGPTTLFTLDRSSSAPIAANNDSYLGSMYYDTTTGKIQCYESDGWGACGSAPDNIVNLNPEFAGAVLNGSGVGTMNADFCGNGGGLSVNTGLCASGEARNFYKWTSPQASQQTYSIYVTYQLPASFKAFADDNTVQLTARRDSSNATVTYQMYRSEGGNIVACGTETTVTTQDNTWQTVGINGNESTGCGFTTSSANAFVIFKINVKAQSNANAYVGTLGFTTTGR